MSRLPDNSENDASLPLVSKCRSKNGSQGSASGSGGCGCKQRNSSPLASEVMLPSTQTTSVEAVAILATAEATTGTATMEESLPPKAACGCGHHAAESAAPQAEAAAAGSTCKCQKLRWIRKTHAALGLLFGLFLVEHFTATALGLR